MKRAVRLFCFMLLGSIYSCHPGGNTNAVEFAQESYKAAPGRMGADVADVKEVPTPAERKIIKEGSVTFETSSAQETRNIINERVHVLNGYIANDNAYTYSDKTEYHVTIRVPAEKFDELLSQIYETARKIDSKSINALDVTEEFVDVEARIRTKKELETRYRELLKQATKVEDILMIEREMGTLRTEIESFEGRLKYLTDRVSMSTLTVVFYEKTQAPFRLMDKVSRGLKNGWKNMLWFIIGLINVWPFILAAAIAVFFVRRFALKRKHRKANE